MKIKDELIEKLNEKAKKNVLDILKANGCIRNQEQFQWEIYGNKIEADKLPRRTNSLKTPRL